MTKKIPVWLILLLSLLIFPFPAQAQKKNTFEAWLADFRSEAAAKGVSQKTLQSALSRVQYLPKVLELQKNQPEFKFTVEEYLARVVSEARALRGREVLAEHLSLLDKINERYGVPPQYLVALWGIETDYGKMTGGFPVLDAMATLAYGGSRSDFFRSELLYALRIIDRGHISPDKMVGSWAGATGQLQFMPSTFYSYAVDYNGDGRIDIWNNLEDIFASAANYLSRSGWVRAQPWGWEVSLPRDFDTTLLGLNNRKSLEEWEKLGVRHLQGENVKNSSAWLASVVAPDGQQGRAFMAMENYRVIYRWNQSHHFAVAVGVLADRIAAQQLQR
jgi:membrane-bound lytic murein transglycosylase B